MANKQGHTGNLKKNLQYCIIMFNTTQPHLHVCYNHICMWPTTTFACVRTFQKCISNWHALALKWPCISGDRTTVNVCRVLGSCPHHAHPFVAGTEHNARTVLGKCMCAHNIMGSQYCISCLLAHSLAVIV